MKQLVALMNAGRDAELETSAHELLQRHPNAGILWQFLGVALGRQAKDDLQALQMAAQLLPEDAAAHNNLGNALGRLGRLEDAVARYRHALRLSPQFAEAHNNLGHALLDLRQLDAAAASLRRAIEANPRYAEAHDNLGTALLGLGRPDEAIASHRRALEIEAEFPEAHNNLGNALLELGRLDEAQASYRRALEINPNFTEAHNNLGNGLRALGQLDSAEASYRRALEINPNFAEAHCTLGIALRLQGRTAEAQASCRRALELKPKSPEAYAVLAESSADLGDFAQAERMFERAISMAPGSPELWAAIPRLRRMTRDDAPWLAQAQRIAERGLPARQEIALRYAFGKYFDDVQDFEQAFTNFRRANELSKLRRAPYDPEQLTGAVDLMTRTYDQGWVGRPRPNALESGRPVLVVGMLRSGTSLAEQILASHPAAFGAGELTFWNSALAGNRAAALAGARSDAVLPQLAGDYLQLLRSLSGDALRVVDKMPTNFPYLGPIHAALPNARIIHLRRNPADTCLSIYFQHFEATVSYANDLDDLAHYYTEYLRVMAHWRSILPEHVLLEVPYEGLVAQQEAWTRRMLDFIGLPWDPRCLEFQKTNRTVITASKWQVRQAMMSSSVARRRNYEKFLGPLRRLMQSEPLNGGPAAPSNCE
ncbi:MAG TPA: tetratricopeptide repeat protein [Steroidobacteraceae bacterium]|jgi:tetratricopeptide (TPR) repeat protein|nr:tetratricopeptide repeat protein [Steroidobacteraceae bacterium]